MDLFWIQTSNYVTIYPPPQHAVLNAFSEVPRCCPIMTLDSISYVAHWVANELRLHAEKATRGGLYGDAQPKACQHSIHKIKLGIASIFVVTGPVWNIKMKMASDAKARLSKTARLRVPNQSQFVSCECFPDHALLEICSSLPSCAFAKLTYCVRVRAIVWRAVLKLNLFLLKCFEKQHFLEPSSRWA